MALLPGSPAIGAGNLSLRASATDQRGVGRGSSVDIGAFQLRASDDHRITSPANPSVYGQSVTFTATVAANPPGSGTPTGTVQFQIDGTNFGPP